MSGGAMSQGHVRGCNCNECKPRNPISLANKVEQFVKWMEDETDYCMWDLKVKRAVQIKLLEIMGK